MLKRIYKYFAKRSLSRAEKMKKVIHHLNHKHPLELTVKLLIGLAAILAARLFYLLFAAS